MNIMKAILELSQDVEKIEEKEWLKPALISHVCKWTGNAEWIVKMYVDAYFNNPDIYRVKE